MKELSGEQLKDFLDEHYYYEIDMLAYSVKQLMEGQAQNDQNKINMAIECFLLHARNLYEFYFHQPNKNYSRAADIIMEWRKYCPAKTANIQNQEKRINLELSHLTYKRIAGRVPEKQWDCAGLYNDYLSITKAFLDRLPNKYMGKKIARLKAIGDFSV